MQQDSSQALANTAVSMTAATITITQVQPFVTLIAGLVAIFSGVMAIRYYYNATKRVKK
jgi:hypothetical protein